MPNVSPVLALNLTLAFGLELAALAAFGLWGVSFRSTPVSRAILSVGAPLLMAILWGTFLSPKAAVPLSLPYRSSLKFAVFALATTALFTTRHPVSGMIFSSLAVLNLLSLHLLEAHLEPHPQLHHKPLP